MDEKPPPAWVTPVVGVVVAIALALGYFWLTAPESTRVRVGMSAPELSLPSIGPGEVKLSSFRGKPVLLAFFMSSCHICETEVPEIEEIHRTYRRRGLIVLGVSADADYAARERFVREKNLSFGLLHDPHGEKILEAFGSHKLPEAYLIDAGGVVRAVWLGAVAWRSPDVRQQIESVLPPEPPERPAT
jgi:peroxiredoxin